jgi:hypothetical protein
MADIWPLILPLINVTSRWEIYVFDVIYISSPSTYKPGTSHANITLVIHSSTIYKNRQGKSTQRTSAPSSSVLLPPRTIISKILLRVVSRMSFCTIPFLHTPATRSILIAPSASKPTLGPGHKYLPPCRRSCRASPPQVRSRCRRGRKKKSGQGC